MREGDGLEDSVSAVATTPSAKSRSPGNSKAKEDSRMATLAKGFQGVLNGWAASAQAFH